MTAAKPVPRQAAHLLSILLGLVCFIFVRGNPSGLSALTLGRIRHPWISNPCRADASCYFQHISLPSRQILSPFLPKQSGPDGAGGAELGPQAE
ncbi:hypothetical protein [Bradyrhizobium sp.]|uniref:hypothetical protein n=1 Tax=Bradyrhizobium sp. TaxID=376 RepID=UPI00260B2E3B|nr:hypothetical protein [Bradyrhizobium sp.]